MCVQKVFSLPRCFSILQTLYMSGYRIILQLIRLMNLFSVVSCLFAVLFLVVIGVSRLFSVHLGASRLFLVIRYTGLVTLLDHLKRSKPYKEKTYKQCLLRYRSIFREMHRLQSNLFHTKRSNVPKDLVAWIAFEKCSLQ